MWIVQSNATLNQFEELFRMMYISIGFERIDFFENFPQKQVRGDHWVIFAKNFKIFENELHSLPCSPCWVECFPKVWELNLNYSKSYSNPDLRPKLISQLFHLFYSTYLEFLHFSLILPLFMYYMTYIDA